MTLQFLLSIKNFPNHYDFCARTTRMICAFFVKVQAYVMRIIIHIMHATSPLSGIRIESKKVWYKFNQYYFDLLLYLANV